MLALSLTAAGGHVERVLAIGCHADDIEIGCGATLLALTRKRPLHVTWVVIAASGARADEARESADAFLTDAALETTVDTSGPAEDSVATAVTAVRAPRRHGSWTVVEV